MSLLESLVDWAVSLIGVLGGPGAAVAVALENLFPPIPSELVLGLTGLAAARGELTLAEAIAWTTAGSLGGALVLYALGRWLGVDRVKRIARWVPLVDATDIDRAVGWFDRHGSKAVLLGRMVPIYRSLISVPAGVTRMPVTRFTALTAAGSLAWNSLFVGAGFLLGGRWVVVERYADALQQVVVVATLLALGYFVVHRLRSRRAAAAE